MQGACCPLTGSLGTRPPLSPLFEPPEAAGKTSTWETSTNPRLSAKPVFVDGTFRGFQTYIEQIAHIENLYNNSDGLYEQICEIFHAVNVYEEIATAFFSAYTLLKGNR